MGKMQWIAPDHLCIPAPFERGCLTRVGGMEIEWTRR